MTSSLWFWAKLGHETWPEKYHPVTCHLIDVAAVALELWDAVFRPRFREWVAGRLGLEEDACRRWLAFLAGAHDIGKVAWCFQIRNDRTQALEEKVAKAGFPQVSWDKPHGTISTAILAELLAEPGAWPALERRLANRVAVAVGGHHGLFPSDWNEVADLLQCARRPCPWDAARREILATLSRLLCLGSQAPQLPASEDQSVFMALAGLTSVADWIGSNQAFFQPVGNPAVVEQGLDLGKYFQDAQTQARDALKQLGWLDRGVSGGTRTFRQLFANILGGKARPLQEAAEEIAGKMTGPALLLIEAPMGEGKTEAAWFLADTWERAGGQGVYVALPTMATSNQMLERVDRFLQETAGKKNLMLQHGKAALNEQFEKLRYAARVYDEDGHPSAVVAEAWFAANKKHGLLAPYGVGTIDQALLAVLQTKHVFVRLFGLAGKCVILDEVHAYDAYMTTLMERLLRWLAALACPVVLLSATLPRDKRLKLLRAYAGDDLPEPDDKPYPRLTSVAIGGQAEVRQLEADADRASTVHLGWLDEGDLPARLRQSLAEGGCAVAIRNTVNLAQQTYAQLREALKEDPIEVELFHARFPFGRRMEIENAVLQRFGKESRPAERNRRVLVATQVVEQSLDLDFDLMVSDVAPVDLVLQRAGRLHRHGRGPRAAGVADPRLWLIEPGKKEGLPDFGSSEWVYARFILLRSYLALKAATGMRLPADLEGFVEQVYGSSRLAVPDGWQAALDESWAKLNEDCESRCLDANDVAISDPDGSPLEQQSQQLEEEDPEAAKKIQAQTRASEPTIQLIVIYRRDGRDFLDAEGTEPFAEKEKPTIVQIRRLLRNEVTLNHPACVAYYAQRPIPPAWRKCGMLRHHRILRLDQNGQSLTGEFFLRLDSLSGIRFEKI